MVVLVMVEAGTHLDEPWFRWRDGVVPFYFQARRHISWYLFLNSSTKRVSSRRLWYLDDIYGHQERTCSGYVICDLLMIRVMLRPAGYTICDARCSGHARGWPGVCAQWDAKDWGRDLLKVPRKRRCSALFSSITSTAHSPNTEILHLVHLVLSPGPLKGHHLLVKTQGHGSCLGSNRKSRYHLHWELERANTRWKATI